MKIIQNGTGEYCEKLKQITKDLSDFGFNDIMPIPLVIDRLNRNELIIIENESAYVLGYVFNDGLVRTFFIFWCKGEQIQACHLDFFEFCKTQLHCKKISLRSNSKSHNRLYERILRSYNLHKSYLFSIDI